MSSFKRQQAEANLPPAPKTMLAHVWNLCLEAGIVPNKDDFTFMHRAMIDYLSTTGEGKRAMLKILNATTKEGSYANQYYTAGHVGDETKKLDYRGLIEYRGWIYRGKGEPFNAVDIWEKPDLEACEMCGGLFPKTYCVQTAKTVSNGREHLENMCNRCRLAADDPKVRGTAAGKTCELCSIKTCRYHPEKERALKLTSVPSNPFQPGRIATTALLEHKQGVTT